MSDIFEADIFQEAGLTSVSTEEKVEFVREFGRLLSITCIVKAGDDLSEKDQDTLGRLLTQQEGERLEAFLTSRNIDLQSLIEVEAIKIRAAIATSETRFTSVDELLMAVKAEFPATTHQIEFMNLSAFVYELSTDIGSVPINDEQKERLVDTLLQTASYNVQMEVEALLEPEVLAQVSELMEGDETEGEGILLMLKNKIDFVQMNIDELRRQFENIKLEIESLEDGLA